MSVTVLIGGARSGKSSLAVEIGRRFEAARDTISQGSRDPSVTFIATAPASDDDMHQRIARHRAERPAHWITIEEQLDVGSAIQATPTGLLIVDCLTLWTSNMMWSGATDDEIRAQSAQACSSAAGRAGDVVVITNEVGLGIVPDNDVARRYRDVHGGVNQQWVQAADIALHLVGGRATRLVDPWTLLDPTF